MIESGGDVGVPIRTCIGCRRRAPAADLLRVGLVSLTSADAVSHATLIVSRTASGRGAWLCRDVSCLDTARKRKAFSRAFRASVSDAAIAELRTGFPAGPRS